MEQSHTRVSREIAGRTLTIETGKLAKQANGSVTVQYGETIILANVCMADAREGIDFFPLMVDYRESRYAGGKFPGGFFKRESRPSDKETLTSRCIDRPMRPCFPDGFKNEIQILLNVISYDGENDSDIPAMIAAFAAVAVSDIPFNVGLGAVRIAKSDGQLVVNPTNEQVEGATINLTIAGSSNAIMMVEGGAVEESEESMLEALDLAQEVIREVIGLIEEIRSLAGKPKIEFIPPAKNDALIQKVTEISRAKIQEAINTPDKHLRVERVKVIVEEAVQAVQVDMEAAFQNTGQGQDPLAILEHRKALDAVKKEVSTIIHDIEKDVMRLQILDQGVRSDQRSTTDIRFITSEVSVIPRTHGSAVFTRGQTQALVTATLGTMSDEQKIDGLTEDYYKKFMLNYNFPPYCVGEVRPIRGPGRREIGHGALAERALTPIIPSHEDFPYTVRIVSEILESNGSSSMASVCGGSLALMDAGVPVKAPVAGIAMGLIKEGDRFAVLSDILGVEDHLGDMDFKVAGTRNGITAFQMDLKIEGITREIMAQALEQARQGRLHILGLMEQAIPTARTDISQYAPRIHTTMIPIDKIRDVIGPGGKTIRKIVEETGAKIEIEDDGRVTIASADGESLQKAKDWIEVLTEEVEVGKVYKGKVTRIVTFGAFVEVLPGQEGLVHISQLHEDRVGEVTDVVNEGDEIDVKVIEIDEFNRVNLSKKQADQELGNEVPPLPAGSSRPSGGGGGGGGRRDGGGGGGGGRRGGGGGRRN